MLYCFYWPVSPTSPPISGWTIIFSFTYCANTWRITTSSERRLTQYWQQEGKEIQEGDCGTKARPSTMKPLKSMLRIASLQFTTYLTLPCTQILMPNSHIHLPTSIGCPNRWVHHGNQIKTRHLPMMEYILTYCGTYHNEWLNYHP